TKTWLYTQGTSTTSMLIIIFLTFQMAGKMRNEQISHLNSSPPIVDPSMYGYVDQKRSVEDGGKLVAISHFILLLAVLTEDFKVPDRMVGFIIGRGGEQITRIQLESGCKIQIASESGGMMDRACSLNGTPESIEQAKRMLGQIVDRCRNSPGFHSEAEDNSSVHEMLIPASKVGLVIGRGGDTIKQLQERIGVKMMMIQDGPMPTGMDKPLRITGDPYKVHQARELVIEIIRDKYQGDLHSGRNDFASRLGGSTLDVAVPRFAVGIVIGRSGEMIKKIQGDSGVRIQFKPDDGISPERIAQVMGQPDRCQHAVQLINELTQTAQERDGFGSSGGPRGRGRGRGDWVMGSPGGLQEVTYTILADKCGLVIGKGGDTIKSINQQSGAHVELQRNPPPNTDPNVRVFSIRGTPQQMEVACQLIDDKIGVSSPKSSLKLDFYFRNEACFPLMARKKLVQATFLSVIDYGDLLYMHATTSFLQRLDSVYHASLRFITNAKTLTHHCTLYQMVGWTSLYMRRKIHLYVFIYKALLGKFPLQIKSNFICHIHMLVLLVPTMQ
uniref:K Homology domain-containing protein n=1 Tax=Oncorhynchus kisutch TaxID=8019 RepID=A0A8C7F2I1_ONCKI